MIRVQITVEHGHGVVSVDERALLSPEDDEGAVVRAVLAAVSRAEKRTVCAVTVKPNA